MSAFQTIMVIILVWEQETESSPWRKREKDEERERKKERERISKIGDNLLISNSLSNFLDEGNRYS